MKYLNIGLIALFLISISNIAHGFGFVRMSKVGSAVGNKQCLLVINKGNVIRRIEKIDDSRTELWIAYDNYLYPIIMVPMDNIILCRARRPLIID